MKLQELSKEEQMAISGGDTNSNSIWYFLGLVFHGFYEGAKHGGYAACKCP